MSRAIKFNSVSIPDSVIAGQHFVVSVDIDFLPVLYDKSKNELIDSNNTLLLTDEEYVSAYSGSEINNFIAEVLNN